MIPSSHEQFDRVADGLAENGFAIIDHFLSADEVKDILATDGFQKGLLHFKKAAIGKSQEKQINESIRGDYIQWIDRSNCHASLLVYLQRLQQLITHLNESLFLSMKDYEVHQTSIRLALFINDI
jgi:hypothetical protein